MSQGVFLNSIGYCVLAAGMGSRLKLNIPKVVLPICGKPMILHVLDSINQVKKESDLIGVVLGHKKELVEKTINSIDYISCHQKKQLGTADAVKSYFESSPLLSKTKYTMVMCGDTPLLSSSALDQLSEKIMESDTDAVVATFLMDNPFGYGRVKREDLNIEIVEEKDASDLEKMIKEVNSALYIFKTSFLKDALEKIDNNNAAKEYYLPDVFRLSSKSTSIIFTEREEFLGVNTLIQAAEIEKIMQKKIIINHQLNGVRFVLPETTYIEKRVEIASGVVVESHSTIKGKTKIGKNALIEAGCYIQDTIIEDEVHLLSQTRCEDAIIKKSSVIGPFARIRPGTIIGEKCKVGNFVETKKSILENEVKISHLSYVGDAEIGSGTNIGCGFITCNYDGEKKHKSIIGKNCFIGSDSQLIAPIKLGDRVYIGSGSTINRDVPSDAFAIARERQVIKEGLSKKFIKKKE